MKIKPALQRGLLRFGSLRSPTLRKPRYARLHFVNLAAKFSIFFHFFHISKIAFSFYFLMSFGANIGEYYLNGIEVSKYSEKQRTKLRKGIIGFVFQSFNLIEELNVYENIELPLLYMGISGSERRKRIQAAMDRMQISHREKHFPQQLSGGQQQRVAIARAVVANPKLILADEPTGNLDSRNGKEVMNLLTELNKDGTTIVMVTHSQHDAGFASRIVNLFDGQVVTEVRL